MKRVEFIQKYFPLVKKLGDAIGIFPEIVFAQAFLEGGNSKGEFGKSYTMIHGNNIFNIKASKGWKGETVVNPYVKSESNVFRAYDSLEDSIKDYFSFLVKNSRYKDAGVFSASDYQEQAEAMQRSGYAGSSTTYGAQLKKIGAGVAHTLATLGEKIKEGATAAAHNVEAAAHRAGDVVSKNKFSTGVILTRVALGLLYLSNGRK